MNSLAGAMLPVAAMTVLGAIYHRRAVRDYAPDSIDSAVVRALLDAAVHAPTAMHEEPCAFAVIQDKKILNRLSDSVKGLLARGEDPIHPRGAALAHDRFTSKDFNAFYNAGTLIVICAKPVRPFVVADCWLAAENLMLAACAKGLGSCPIGLSVTALNTPEWKKELGLSTEMTAIAPIIVGVPAGETTLVPRKTPEILVWK
jgi:nitroreductase